MNEHAHPTVKTFVAVWAALLVLTGADRLCLDPGAWPLQRDCRAGHCDRQSAAGAAVLHGTALLHRPDQSRGGCGHFLPGAAGRAQPLRLPDPRLELLHQSFPLRTERFCLRGEADGSPRFHCGTRKGSCAGTRPERLEMLQPRENKLWLVPADAAAEYNGADETSYLCCGR